MNLTERWVFLGIISLALAGLLSIAIALLRIPELSILLLPSNIFDTSLIIHVNLSVLVWNCSIIISCLRNKANIYTNTVWYLALIGTVFIAISPMIPETNAVKNNYIPVLDNIVFFTGLSLFSCGVIISAVFALTMWKTDITKTTNAGILIITFINFIMAYNNMPAGITLHDFYEYLFWGGGHTLQFAFVQTMILVYTILLNTKLDTKIYLVNFLFVLPTPIIYLVYELQSTELQEFFSWHMRIFGGLIFIAFFLHIIVKERIQLLVSNKSVLCSFILFFYGGLLGFYISGTNTTIPAHYHGSIVAVTIAFMGFAYSKFHVREKIQNLQIYIYSIGQTLHITGLSWMGSYGALRKTQGVMLPQSAVIGKILFIVGGAITAIGGLAFIIIMLHKYVKKEFNGAQET